MRFSEMWVENCFSRYWHESVCICTSSSASPFVAHTFSRIENSDMFTSCIHFNSNLWIFYETSQFCVQQQTQPGDIVSPSRSRQFDNQHQPTNMENPILCAACIHSRERPHTENRINNMHPRTNKTKQDEKQNWKILFINATKTHSKLFTCAAVKSP